MNRQTTLTDWIRLVIASALAVALGVIVGPGAGAPVSATSLLVPDTSFELDGNLAGDVPGTGYDWQDPYGPGLTPAPNNFLTTGVYYVNRDADPCFSIDDDQGASGPQVKLGDGPVWRTELAQVNPQANDLAGVWLAAEKVAVPNGSGGSDITDVLYVGYELCETSNGTFNGALYLGGPDSVTPFDQNGQATGSTDDYLAVFEFKPNAQPVATVYGFNGTAWVLDGSAIVPGSFESDASGDRIIGELAINLQVFAGGLLPRDECSSITVEGQVATIAGLSLTSAVKDVVGVTPLTISNCGAIDIEKDTDPAGIVTDPIFDYVLDQADSGAPGDGVGEVHDDSLTAQFGEPDADLEEISAAIGGGDLHQWANVISQPDYELVELAPLPSGWAIQSITCTYYDIFPVYDGGALVAGPGLRTGVVIHDGTGYTGTQFMVPPSSLGGMALDPASCVIVNETAAIQVVKAGSGDPTQDFAFTATGQSPQNLRIADDLGTAGVDETTWTFAVDPNGGDITLEETIPVTSPSWSLDSIVCESDDPNATNPILSEADPADGAITISPEGGATITCTYTNVQQSSLTLIKEVTNDNGGTATAGAWTLSASGPTPLSDTTPVSSEVAPGQYDLSESGGPGDYTASNWVCVGGSQNDADTVTLASGESATCTITNDDDAPSLTLVKQVVNDNGGTSVPGDWTLTAAGYDAASPGAGTYDLSESGPAGYTLTSLTCDNAVGQVTSVTLDLGEDVTCTFVNDDDAPSLTLVKQVVNDNGGTSVAGDWTLTAAGYSAASPQIGTYDLSESGPAGYTLTSLTCDNAVGQVTSVTLDLGEDVTCTFVNDDDAPMLILVKEVVNDNGGTALATDWTLTATGYDEVSPDAGSYPLSETGGPDGYTLTSLTCDNAVGQVTSATLGLGETVTCTFVNDDDAPSLTLVKQVVNDNGGTAVPGDWTLAAAGYDAASPDAGTYDLSESGGPVGYTLTSLTCDNAEGQVSSVTLGLGEDVTCTFVNDDDQPGLTLIKRVVNDNGGTALVDDWTLTASGDAGTLEGTSGVTDSNLSAGTYDLSESGPAGYTRTSLTCSNDPGVEVTSVTLGLGDSVTCTFVNDDDVPSLTLVKQVTNDNGGLAVAGDWTLTAAGPTPVSGTTGVSSDASFEAGVYDLAESGPAGYTLTSLTCDNAQGQVTSVTVGLGEDVTCTFVNDDDAASLTLVKQVANDNGGTAVAGDWTLTADGPTPVSGATGVSSDASFEAGVYDLSESGPAGYTLTSLTCSGAPDVEVTSVTLGLGDSVTCTFVNDDDAPSLTLIKVLENDDGAGASLADFSLTADGPTGISGTSGVTSGVDFEAGTYDLSESGPIGYVGSAWVCEGGSQTDDDTVSIGLGQDVVCTITNDDLPVDLQLVKGDDGFEAVAGGDPVPYTITVRNVGTRDADLDEPVTVVDTLPAGMSWNTFPANCSAVGRVLTCDIDPAEMTAGGPAVVIETLVDVAAGAPSGVYENHAYVTTDDDPVCTPAGDCVPPPCPQAASSNNVDCENTPVDREATITIVKVDDVAAGEPVLVGDTFQYTLRVTNNGPSTIQPGLTVTDDLPAQLELVDAVGNNWSCNDADAIVCTYGPSLAPGATAPTITVTVQVSDDATGDTIENVAVATGFVEPGCPAADDCEPVTDEDGEITPLLANADLAIVKTASVELVQAPGTFSFTLDVTNNGPAPALDVVVGDLVPTSVTVTGVASTFFDCGRDDNDVTCTIDSMDVGESGTVTITVSVPANVTAGSIDNVGTVESQTPDPDLSNNSDDASVDIVAQQPPVTVAPTIPRTGTDATGPMVKAALLFLLLGVTAVVATRRRREDVPQDA